MVNRFTITAAEQDPWIDADPSGQWVRYSDYAALEANLAAVKEALEEIQGKGGALRQGGPDPMDLHDLSDALEEATDLAADALSALEATPPAPVTTECDYALTRDELAAAAADVSLSDAAVRYLCIARKGVIPPEVTQWAAAIAKAEGRS